ncbi:hypothetical protein [Desulfobacula toluolica]|uniref:Uncharacterized protein n=1 Tax=Desulfobacula toluolica (strain DSM 7467 / Tol2) TaxID=651182 RepID=K0NIF7_DESTT|nr:hypothetical protein [Desulfobacula toluolica]CCK81186.1 uncharacterized protein TOL2_C30270 [Desulfobacula toluolica Tol2]
MNYTITFNDGIVYSSPDIRETDPGWASENGEKLTGIGEMSIKLPNKKILILKGFEKYNFFVEASQAFGKKAKARIESFFFCGAWRGHVVSWEINYKTRQVLKRMALEGREYHGTATRGWRMGLMGEKAESGLCPLV